MTVETHFHLNGFVNKQNSDIGEWKIQVFKLKGITSPTRNCVVRNYVRPHYWPQTQKALQRQSMEEDIDTCSIHS